MKNKHLIFKIFIIAVAISLIGISYGYWTEQLSIKGNATLSVQLSVIDNVTTVVRKKVNKKTEVEKEDGNNQVDPIEEDTVQIIDKEIEGEPIEDNNDVTLPQVDNNDDALPQIDNNNELEEDTISESEPKEDLELELKEGTIGLDVDVNEEIAEADKSAETNVDGGDN